MSWRTIVEEAGERTEVLEIARRGALVRIAVQDGDKWRPVTMTWCAGLRAQDFLPAPPGAETPTETGVSAPSPGPSANPDAPDLLPLVQQFATTYLEVLTAFRAKMGRASGQIGFLDHVPQVGGFSAGKQGDWVWRVDEGVVSLSSRKKLFEVPLPTHTNDTAFTSNNVANYLKGTGVHSVSCDGGVHAVDAPTVAQLFDRLVELGKLRQFTRVPPLYVVP